MSAQVMSTVPSEDDIIKVHGRCFSPRVVKKKDSCEEQEMILEPYKKP